MNRTFALAFLVLLFIAVFAVGTWASHRWGCYSFPDQNISWYNGATGDYFNVYQEEALTDGDSWHSTIINLTSVGSPGTSDRINAYNGFFGTTGWLGLASVFSNGCTINYGEARLNQTYLDSPSYSRTNKKHVACQEVGHLFGLDHNRSQTNTCMNDTILTAPQPNQHDRDLLNSIYGPPPTCIHAGGLCRSGSECCSGSCFGLGGGIGYCLGG